MTLFRYRALNLHGKRVRGRLNAASLDELEQRLRAQGLLLINGEPCRALWRARQAIPRRELIDFCFHLEQLLEAGVPPYEALNALNEASLNPAMKAVVSTLLTEVAQGQALSAAAARQPTVFPAVFVSLLNAGEQSGNLSGAVRDIGAALTHDEALSAYARRIAIYPAIVGSILLLAVVIALVHVVPQLETLFAGNGQVLPLQTRVLVGLSRLAIDWGWALLAGLGLLLAAARVALARSEALRIRFDTHLLHLPLLGEIRRKLALARFAALFATLYAAGITVIDALRTSADVTGNLALREGLRTATERIEQGQPLSAAFDSIALFPPLIARMIRVGEHTGALDRALANVASLYRRDIAESIARLQATLEPALTLLMGGLLLWIATAVLGPIYDIITQLPT